MRTRGACRLPAAGDEGDGPPEGERELRRHRVLVGHAADAVGAEERARGRDAAGVMARLLRSPAPGPTTSAGLVSSTLTPRWPEAISTATGSRPGSGALGRAGPRRAAGPRRRAPRDLRGGAGHRRRVTRDGSRRAGRPRAATAQALERARLAGLPRPRGGHPDAAAALEPRAAGPRAPTLTRSVTVRSAPSTETGSVKALSISWTRLRGPATSHLGGIARDLRHLEARRGPPDHARPRRGSSCAACARG